jgi:hypothetical protein
MKNRLLHHFRPLLQTSRVFGFDPRNFYVALVKTPRYLKDLIKFIQKHGIRDIVISPAITDYTKVAGTATGHYFWQDLICAQWVNANSPIRHLDVGSRVDGFIAHLLSFRKVELLDIRPLGVEIPGLTIQVRDLMIQSEPPSLYESVSSLHALEHFGLGRYGDPINVNGHEIGLKNLAGYVRPGGLLYVSFPIGKQRVQFNSQRILDPEWPLQILDNFELEEFVLIPWDGQPQFGELPKNVDKKIEGQAGLYKLRKV